MQKLLSQLKENGDDLEFYPTKGEIVRDLHDSLTERYRNVDSILDIGAGNGILFKQLRELDDEYERCFIKAYAIEKSQTLINQMEPNIFILGTDFHQQTLIDKEVSVIFCNPPYSEYEEWSTRIILEGNCDTIYLVIPDRWENSKSINNAIKQREAKVKKI